MFRKRVFGGLYFGYNRACIFDIPRVYTDTVLFYLTTSLSSYYLADCPKYNMANFLKVKYNE